MRQSALERHIVRCVVAAEDTIGFRLCLSEQEQSFFRYTFRRHEFERPVLQVFIHRGAGFEQQGKLSRVRRARFRDDARAPCGVLFRQFRAAEA